MGTVLTPDVGRVWVPEMDSVTVGPAFPTGRRRAYAGVVSYIVRPGRINGEPSGGYLQRGYGVAMPATEGLHQKWAEHDELQRYFAKPEDFVFAAKRRLFTGSVHHSLLTGKDAGLLLRQAAVAHNERGVYGGRLIAKLAFAFVSSPTNSTVVAPNYIAINKTSTFTSGNFTFAKCGSSQSLSDGIANVGANVATNEFATNGLSRAIGTLSAYADSTALDGVFTGTIAKTFTDTTAPSTFYGAALVDAVSTGAFNLFAESAQATGTLQIADTLTETWSISA